MSALAWTNSRARDARGARWISLFLACLAILPAADIVRADEPPIIVHVLLRDEPGVPSPQDVVEHHFESGGKPPLESLSVGNPLSASYLLTKRATGNFRAYLDQNPQSDRAKLERYIVLVYPSDAKMNAVLDALSSDAAVETVYVPPAVSLVLPDSAEGPLPPSAAPSQYWINLMNFPAAWQLAGGWSLVGVMDGGLQPDHPDLRSFQGTTYVGGNYLPVYSRDTGRDYPGSPYPVRRDLNVDELEPVNLQLNGSLQEVCDPDNDGIWSPTSAGHGTHVSGLVAANHNATYSGDGTRGACKYCGIAAWRVLWDRPFNINGVCVVSASIPLFLNSDFVGDTTSRVGQIEQGVQVINGSFEFPAGQAFPCGPQDQNASCLSIKEAEGNGIVQVGASGNFRTAIAYPANTPQVVAVGGLNESLGFWDDFPNCPFPQLGFSQCGSNYTTQAGGPKQEVVAPAKNVLSTFYQGGTWNATIGCSDQVNGVAGDGQGGCTGTSMSTPIIAGLFGLLRSINPLVLPGDPEVAVDEVGVRDVVVASSSQMPVPGWIPTLGYGIPDAAEAASTMLGVSNGVVVKNRATPLFSLYSAGVTDWATVAIPQEALALMNYSDPAWTPAGGSTVPGYPSFPHPTGTTSPPAPRAIAFVMTTEVKTQSSHPNLIPLYLFDRIWLPPGCTEFLEDGCSVLDQDFLLTTDQASFPGLVSQGYRLRGRQGYVYQTCSPEPTCVPPGAERLYRKCKTADNDCATFLERDRPAFEAAGYTAAVPAGSSQVLGYAYPPVDSDNDGLVDGMERLIGTNVSFDDSDLDCTKDGLEFPQAGVSRLDPLVPSGSPSADMSAELQIVNIAGGKRVTAVIRNLGPCASPAFGNIRVQFSENTGGTSYTVDSAPPECTVVAPPNPPPQNPPREFKCGVGALLPNSSENKVFDLSTFGTKGHVIHATGALPSPLPLSDPNGANNTDAEDIVL